MNFIKKYLALVIPALIAIIAIGMFIPAILIGRTVKQDMEDSLSLGSQIDSLVKKTPSRKQADQEKAYQDKHEEDTDKIVTSVTQSNQRELISYDIFPKPMDESSQLFIEFGKVYRTTVRKLVKSMDALDAPSDKDIRKETSQKSHALTSRSGSRSSGTSDAIKDAVCRKRAESIPIYANPSAFRWHEYWDEWEYEGLNEALEDCWYSQVAYWIYEDVVASIKKANGNSSKVYTSDVKRLLGIGFERVNDYTKITSSGKVSTPPMYVMDDEIGIFGIKPWTGRKSDGDIDVLHFTFTVIIDSKAVIPFMKVLCSEKEHQFRENFKNDGQLITGLKHNQITILQSEISPVDKTIKKHTDYRYGDNATVRLDLICEYIFSRNGYEMIKPKTIKELFDPMNTSKSSGGRKKRK